MFRPLIVVAIVIGTASHAAAQAWVPPKGEGTVSFTYQTYHHTGHFDKSGHKNTNGATESKALVTELDFGLTNTIGLNVSLVGIASRYTGSPSYIVDGIVTTPGPLDNGKYHAAFQDVRVEARRMFLAGPVALAPYVAFAVPTHHYETRGEAVPGRRRRELQLGASAETSLNALLPRSYVHGRYTYARLEPIDHLPHTRSIIDAEAGYDVTRHVGVRGLMALQIAHKRPTRDQLLPIWDQHDRFINSSYFNIGAGISVDVSRQLELYGVWSGTVRGNRGAHVARVLAIGVTRNFGGGLMGLGR